MDDDIRDDIASGMADFDMGESTISPKGKMSGYLISEEERRKILDYAYIPPALKRFIENMFKSKKPVRLIASGHIYYTQDFIDVGVGYTEHLDYGFNGLTPEIAKENESCPAKLFVEEE